MQSSQRHEAGNRAVYRRRVGAVRRMFGLHHVDGVQRPGRHATSYLGGGYDHSTAACKGEVVDGICSSKCLGPVVGDSCILLCALFSGNAVEFHLAVSFAAGDWQQICTRQLLHMRQNWCMAKHTTTTCRSCALCNSSVKLLCCWITLMLYQPTGFLGKALWAEMVTRAPTAQVAGFLWLCGCGRSCTLLD